MVQMTAADQAIVKALPGNALCCDCDQQLKMMKMGGNDKCNAYLATKGVDKRSPIKQKYESDAAQLYKLVLKARVEGKPEPTELPKTAPKSGGARPGGAGDPNGMERLAGETDQQYIARQTRLKEEAKARMAAKFGGSGGMGGVGSGGRSTMQGIGSDPNYDPNRSAAGGGFDMDSLVTGLGSAISSAGSMASSVKSSVLSEENMNAMKSTSASFWGSLTAGVNNVASSVNASGVDSDGLADLQRQVAASKPSQSKYGGFGSDAISPSVSSPTKVGSALPPSTTPSSGGAVQEAQGLPGEDRNGIERLTGETDEQYVARQTRLRDEARARMAAKFGGGGLSSASSSGMGGFGGGGMSSAPPVSAPAPAPAAVQEAPGLPGEDRNGIERLTGESDDQYVARQTRLREEARARMAAKFGGGGLSSASSNSRSAPSSGNAPSFSAAPPSSGNAPSFSAAPRSGGVPSRSSSGDKSLNSDDFFSSFGS